MNLKNALKLTGALVLAAAIVGCGDTDSARKTTNPGQPSATRTVDLIYGDCSSFRRYTKAFVPDMVTIAQTSALATPRRTLWAGCFDGAPLRTLVWKPKIDFSELRPELRANRQLADRFVVARALGLKRQFEAMASTPTRVPGSGQLEALELAAQTQGVGRVFLFTDAEVNQLDGLRLADATPDAIQATINRWAPRLKGLRGAQLMFVGVGRGTANTGGVRNAEALFRGLAKRVGATPFDWNLELPADFRVNAP